MTINLSRDLGGRNTRVNAIADGAVETEGTAALGASGDELEKEVVKATRWGA